MQFPLRLHLSAICPAGSGLQGQLPMIRYTKPGAHLLNLPTNFLALLPNCPKHSTGQGAVALTKASKAGSMLQRHAPQNVYYWSSARHIDPASSKLRAGPPESKKMLLPLPFHASMRKDSACVPFMWGQMAG